MSKHKTAANILMQLAGEAGAQQQYELLLAGGELEADDAAIIKEIIADEKNHTIKLFAMALRYGADKISADDMADNLKNIESALIV